MSAPLVLSVTRHAPDEVVITLDLSRGHAASAGHFPGQPVPPGVVETERAAPLGNKLLNTRITAATDFQVKFRRVIHPGQSLELSLRHDLIKHSLSFEYRQGSETASTGRIKLRNTS